MSTIIMPYNHEIATKSVSISPQQSVNKLQPLHLLDLRMHTKTFYRVYYISFETWVISDLWLKKTNFINMNREKWPSDFNLIHVLVSLYWDGLSTPILQIPIEPEIEIHNNGCLHIPTWLQAILCTRQYKKNRKKQQQKTESYNAH